MVLDPDSVGYGTVRQPGLQFTIEQHYLSDYPNEWEEANMETYS